MSDSKPLEEKLDELVAAIAAVTAFVVEIPEAKLVEMPKLKASIQANKILTENQKKLAIDAAREIKHAVQAKADGGH
ncbi:MAG TPA: hypothetical protein VEQ35_05130 [Beijerinckia sp.]|jgi:hypothetical protein|nr:hypothetical protein [Beijerinckia sp.]